MQLIRNLRKYPLFQGDDFIRRVLTLAIPIMVQQMITSLVNLLDNLMVGQLGETALSAVAAANRFNMIGLFAVNGVAVAAGVYISQFYGAKQYERVKETYRFSLIVSALITVVLVLPGLLIPGKIGLFFVDDLAIVEPMEAYLPLAVLSFIPLIYSLNTQNAMRTLGETKKSLVLSLVAVFSNAFFNYVFIFGKFGAPALGVQGAALGTFLARTLELIASWLMVRKYQFIFASKLREIFHIPQAVAKAVALRALPLVLNEIGYSSGMALLFKFYGTRGTDVLAGMSIMNTTSQLFFVLFGGLAVATTIVVGHPLGANDLEGARSNAYRLYKLGLLLATGFSVIMFVFSFFMPHFYDVSPMVKTYASYFLKIYSIFYLVYTVNGMAYQILRTGGDMKLTMVMDSGFFWVVNLPVVGLTAYLTDWSIYVIFVLGQLTDLIKVFVSSYILSKETWVRNLASEVRVESELPPELIGDLDSEEWTDN